MVVVAAPSVCFAWRTASNAPVGFPTKRRRRDELKRSRSPLARESWGSLTTTLSLGNGGGLSADDSVGILLSRLICGERPIGNCNNTALLLVWLVLAPLLFVRDQEGARVLVFPRGSQLLVASRYQPSHMKKDVYSITEPLFTRRNPLS